MKVRHGFVSNSSSSSFTVLLTEDRFDQIKFDAAEKAALKMIGFGGHKLEGVNMIVFTTASGNYDDTEWIKMEDYAEVLVSYAKELSDPMLSEYESELEESKKSVENKAADRQKIPRYHYSDPYPRHWEYFLETFNHARDRIRLKFHEMEQEGFCITTSLDF